VEPHVAAAKWERMMEAEGEGSKVSIANNVITCNNNSNNLNTSNVLTTRCMATL
jgi:hypothetical protein